MTTRLIVLMAAVLVWLVPAAGPEPVRAAEPPSIAGQLLVAAPSMPDPRFAGTVILIVEHTAKGALGFVVNRVNGHRPIAEILQALGRDTTGVKGSINIHWGGPVERDVAVVLHSPDYKSKATKPAPGGFAMTGDPGVLQAIALGKGPKRYFFLRGYAGWSPGQLERELKSKAWVVVPADASLVFARNHAETWRRAFAKRGLDL